MATHPNMFLNQKEIYAIKTRLNREPWRTAYNKFVTKDIPAAINTPIQSVTFSGRKSHDYYTENPYSSDGVYNPNADRKDYESAIKLRDAVRTLGLAYAISNDSVKKVQYANKALQLINGWCLDSATYMTPKYTNEQSRVELSQLMPGMFYGAELIWNYSGWNVARKNQFIQWVKNFVNSAKSWAGKYDNNWELLRLIALASGSVIIEDSSIINYVVSRFKTEIVRQTNTRGVTIKETGRTRSFTYCHLTIQEFLHIAEIIRHYNIDLYNYKTSTGQCIELTLDWIAPYGAHKLKWPYKEISWKTTYQVYSLYELAYRFKQKQSYKDAINYKNPSYGITGRPLYDMRDMGPVTLTHGYYFV